MKGRTIGALAVLAFAASLSMAQRAAADEIRLKDGTKIIGTIVGYENESFKVQTSYGFAFVRKDKVAAIIPSEPKPEAAPEPNRPAAAKKHEPKGTAESRPAAAAEAREVRQKGETPAGASSPGAAVSGTRAAASAPVSTTHAGPSSPATTSPAPASQPAASAAASAPAATPATPPGPPPMREEVQGNLYINHTYAFRLYKPPSWRVIEGAQKTLPTAIVVMGTGDETTLLVIAWEPLKGSLDAQAAATDKQLREIYTNYRGISGQRTRVAGLPAIERRYRGTVDDHDWSGVVLSLARGNEVFTILGMTYADSDLIQIQENVIVKTIASLEFTSR